MSRRYIPKPFNTQYLRSIIKQLLKKQEELKQYYNSSASAFEFSGGQLLQQEDKKFMETAVELINENMDNTEFGPEELAEAMQTSSRNLYRKFKNLDQLPPKDFIKEQRINYAAKLLLTTTLTIQEIMYRTAFTNRSHFYGDILYHNGDDSFGSTIEPEQTLLAPPEGYDYDMVNTEMLDKAHIKDGKILFPATRFDGYKLLVLLKSETMSLHTLVGKPPDW